MKFIPKSAEQVKAEQSRFGPWPKGWYTGVIHSAEEQRSKSERDMCKLTVHVYKGEDKRTLTVYLVPGTAMDFMVRHAAEACGSLAQYEKGELQPEHFYGKTVDVLLGTEKDREDPEKLWNRITDFRKAEPVVNFKPTNGKPAPIPDDEVPF